jgi:hypothetical protein
LEQIEERNKEQHRNGCNRNDLGSIEFHLLFVQNEFDVAE